MESRNGVSRGPSGAHAVSRWSPTKEQTAMLENLYKQGIRTPNTEQIQEITSRLRAYGHIQGKNVFYWFQNHKARQRQKLKQKQQNISYSNNFLLASHPICQNVACAPYCSQHSGISFYSQQAKIFAAGGNGSRIETAMPFGMPKQLQQPDYNYTIRSSKTLTLFPLHPTGILEEKTANQVSPSHSSISVDVTDTSYGSLGVDKYGHP
ncbi:unnamed protein product [Sphenostylis stenocarpa]|uniref:Homeobox domain-containing protein n=1 Tax=Sphenostylis stenocarpa TaxID=92480 RepID=A0AA86SR57_9FABA|nr:unnamed protein product [Sphenostylis stenocarpa]